MNPNPNPPASDPADGPRVLPGERRVRDRRAPWRMWIPTYVLRYCDRIGSHGVTLYALLAWHCTREANVRWPSLNQLARAMAVSRSTVERTMRVLREVELIATSKCIDEQGQRSNYYDLIDPPEFREQNGSHGTTAASAVTDDGAPLSPVKGGAVTTDGGAPSPETAPSCKNGSEEEVCAEGDTHTFGAAPLTEEGDALVAQLAAHWLAHLPPGSASWRAAQDAEIRWGLQLLVARGWTGEQLRAAIDNPARPLGEWPREWVKRLGPRPPSGAKTPPSPAIERQRSLEAARRLEEQRASPEWEAALGELSRRIGRPVGGEG